ncbi:hypothetical protein ACFLSF_00445 [Candidatus Bipolaricaulota bacterium]
MNERVLEAAGFMPMEIITRATADTGTFAGFSTCWARLKRKADGRPAVDDDQWRISRYSSHVPLSSTAGADPRQPLTSGGEVACGRG